MATVKIMFDGSEVECLVKAAPNGEIVCYAKDGRFIKFPKDADLAASVEEHNKANKAKPELTDEEAVDELAEWLNK